MFLGPMLRIKDREQEWLLESLEKMTRKECLHLLLIHNGKAVGILRFDRRGGKRNHIGDAGIRINKEFRGLGLGKSMFEELFKAAKKLKIKKVILDTYENNKRAISFYETLGFKVYGFLPDSVLLKDRLIGEVYLYKELS